MSEHFVINWGALCAYLVATFLVCGIPFGKIIARAKGVDIQAVGSGNIGTTNVAREIGKGAAAATLAFDAGKGTLATGVAAWLFQHTGFVCATYQTVSFAPGGEAGWCVGLVMLAAVCGHIFSPFLGFHGGKGIAVGVGSLLGFVWPLGLLELGIFFVLAYATKRVSVGSVTVAAIVGILVGIFYGWTLNALVVEAAGLIVVWAHRSNIKKLACGQESAFSFHKKGEVPTPDDAEVSARAAKKQEQRRG